MCARDQVLGNFIREKGIIRRRIHADPFTGLLHTIAGQQLSNVAHASIWRRVLDRFPTLDPASMAVVNPEDLRNCGLSLAKASCIKEVSVLVAQRKLPLDEMQTWDEAQITASLMPIKGIGLWTVEMLLIFTFQKENVLSFGDLGIKKGLMKLYAHKEITQDIFRMYKEIYAPYASIAAFYLWEAAAM